MDESALAKRVLQLEVAVATLSSDLRGHVQLCDRRWGVAWKLVTMVSGGIAIVVAVAVEMLWRR